MKADLYNIVLHRLAGALSEDIAKTPEKELMAETAEDFGDPRALAVAFDNIVREASRPHDPAVANGVDRWFSNESKLSFPLTDWLRALWQRMITAIANIGFPNRFGMMAISSACIASVALIIAVPTFYGARQPFTQSPSTMGPAPAAYDPSGKPILERAYEPSPGPGPSVQSSSAEPVVRPAAESKKVKTVAIRPEGSDPMARPVGSVRPQPPIVTAAPRMASTSAPSSGGYVVQLSSERSEADAQASFRSLQSKFLRQLGDRKAMVRRADLGRKGVFYRAMVGPFGNAVDADQFCRDLKAARGQCIVQKN